MTASVTADEFMDKFEAGEDVLEYCDLDHVVIEAPEPCETRNISISLPEWLVRVLDREAERRGIPRKSVINDWLVDRADAMCRPATA